MTDLPDRDSLPTTISPYLPFEPELVLIPAGEFLMGSNLEKDKDADRDEEPQHRVFLPDYYMARTPVTVVQYAAFVQATDRATPLHFSGGKSPAGRENHPVANVSWHSAVAYCSWLAETTGKAYRLPSEAEWEKGARGTDGRIYPWGNQWDAERCHAGVEDKVGTKPVGSYLQGASPYGLLDMAGNVWEWCHSLYRPYPYNATDGREDPEAEEDRMLRGGAFYGDRLNLRCACRFQCPPNYRYYSFGFRVMLAPGAAPS